ncbi:hypothetical protein RvY_09876-2 [Ramazzottius varieornatus]|nr:hypothetical protein RvY_09876-2 [Ramazzottius varieornatus]
MLGKVSEAELLTLPVNILANTLQSIELFYRYWTMQSPPHHQRLKSVNQPLDLDAVFTRGNPQLSIPTSADCRPASGDCAVFFEASTRTIREPKFVCSSRKSSCDQ